MPTFDDASHLDGFAFIVSTPAAEMTVLAEPWPTTGHPRARRFQMRLPLRYRCADDDEWHTAVTDNISHSGVLFRAEQVQPLTNAEPGTPVELLLDVPTDAGAAITKIRSQGRLVRVSGSTDKAIAVSVRSYRLSCPLFQQTLVF